MGFLRPSFSAALPTSFFNLLKAVLKSSPKYPVTLTWNLPLSSIQTLPSI